MRIRDVRFTLESGHTESRHECLKRARSGHLANDANRESQGLREVRYGLEADV